MADEMTRATLGRLPQYLSYIRTLDHMGVERTTAAAIAKAMQKGEVLVRKDLSLICGAGKPKTGYMVPDLIKSMEKRIDSFRKNEAILVGVGNLGAAILDYDGFDLYGVKLAAGFDASVDKVELTKQGKRIYSMAECGRYIREHHISLGIIAVPNHQAQSVCDLMVENGIQAILNFAHVPLSVPQNVIVEYEDLSLSLAYLSIQLGCMVEKEKR